MNTLSRVVLGGLAAACCFTSAAALAQPYNAQGPLTRAQVRAELIEWLQAGYDPLDWIDYPQNAQQAGAIVAQRRAARAAAGAPGAMAPAQ
ncbi:DUF4148 domain-containing protein [Paraburkholderia acidisoli]|uniref:DUF4148 domain-containing protein n=1 Tax=Paraburkholderia acidisoli TaxID=2571748 RepID=A0A7Z2GLI5_9BURK|nr:DUF4148 domain-containing protein [Paraburkholderia acidisoli]QGZ64023.1 DUF4148 domain-containing protein [Paraburkholderia acidisoli]